jgi:autotransporter-associated beta strand protein
MTPTAFAANNIIFGGGTFYANNAFVLNTNRGITLATNATFDVTNAHTLTYGGIITGAYGLTKIDGGELALSGANTYTGSTTVSGGELVLSGGKNSYTGGTIINSGGIVSTGGEGASAGAVANLGKVPTSFISNNMVLNGGTFSANNSFTLHSNRGCLLTANSIIDVTTQQGSNQNLTVAGVISQSGGAFGITKTSGGILKLSASNTYGGNTAISAGILVLTTNGSINNSPLISIVATSTFDVSSNASFVLSSNTTLSASGAGLTTNLGAAVLNGASSGTVNLGTQPISLTFTPTAFAGDSNHPSLYVSQGTLALNGNAFTVNNASGTALGAGNYILIQQASGSVSSSGSYTVNVTGSGLVSGNAASIQVSGGSVDLVVVTPVSTPPVFQAPTQSGGLFTLTWSTVSNQLYQIQSTASLTSPANWTNVGGAITATNTSMILSEPISANSQQFYRVLLLP